MTSQESESQLDADARQVSFRISNPAIAIELASQAKMLGRSPNLHARDLVISSLTRPDELADRIATMTAQVESLRADVSRLNNLKETLSRSLALLLVHAGKLDSTQAHETVVKLLSQMQCG